VKINDTVPKDARLTPKPAFTNGVSEPVVSLDGIWKTRKGNDLSALAAEKDFSAWDNVAVPSFMSMQRRAMPGMTRRYACKRVVEIAEEWAGKSLYLRFESVNGFCEVFIDGQSIGRHYNSFIAFGFDITPYVRGKRSVVLTVAVEELVDKVSTFSVGGILRSVALYVLPQTHITELYAVTAFDSQFRHARLNLRYALSMADSALSLSVELLDPMGMTVTKKELSPIDFDSLCGADALAVENPLPWDAEHPWLYMLCLRLRRGGGLLEETKLRVGLRQIDRAGNRLYVNGQEVKLRGICRHEISPLDGRCLTPELIREDVKLFKEANCNYIRTSHYPPSEYFLDLCDEEGIYVEDELPLAFIGRTLDYTQRDPAQTERYLSVFNELYARDGNHASVLMWSLCNESFGGYNFDLLNRYAHRKDPTRPIKFSYPMTIREEHAPVDIWSIHYANWYDDLAAKRDNVSVAGAPGKDMPVIHDEFVHVPCYNRTEHRRDPHVRTFWGESLMRFWNSIWCTEGALGGAIWAGIDETDIYWGGNTRLEWGIIDVWRRRKPEHYMTRKAYSPIVAALMEGDSAIRIRIENRFCHTNLAEVTIAWHYAGETGTLRGPEALPHATAELPLPVTVVPGAMLELEFRDAWGKPVDEYRFVPLPRQAAKPAEVTTALKLEENADTLTVTGESFQLRFSKSTCLLEAGEANGEGILVGGPVLHTPYFRLGAWQPGGIAAKPQGNAVLVDIQGAYKDTAEVRFALHIEMDGTVRTECTIVRLMRALPHGEKLRVGVDCGGLDELGVAFIAAPYTNRLAWKRRGAFTVYPKDHISRCEGVAQRFSAGSVFGEKPSIPWSLEMRSVILNGKYDVDYRGTNDFRSLKANILTAALYREGGAAALFAHSDGAHSLRLEVEEPEELLVYATDTQIKYTGNWAPVEDYRGSRSGVEMWSKEKDAAAELSFTGTGVVWYGPVDTINGIARVYLDGKLADASVNQRVAGVDFPGSAAGYDKKYGFPLYSVDDMPNGPHTLRIEVTGEKTSDAEDCYIVLDHFRILRRRGEEAVRFAVLNDFNYPHIAWGNYTRPAILVEDGYSFTVTIRLDAPEPPDAE
jgi:hypothetical protein